MSPKNTGREHLPPGFRPFQNRKELGGLFGKKPRRRWPFICRPALSDPKEEQTND